MHTVLEEHAPDNCAGYAVGGASILIFHFISSFLSFLCHSTFTSSLKKLGGDSNDGNG